MGERKEKKPIKRICAGLLAHVDAGKTTIAESILYLTGAIRKLGRVDHRDAFWIPMKWSGPEGSLFFQSRRFLI